jgi:hypothetical protein
MPPVCAAPRPLPTPPTPPVPGAVGPGAVGRPGPPVLGPGWLAPEPLPPVAVPRPPPGLGGTMSPGPRYWPPWAHRAEAAQAENANAKLVDRSLLIFVSSGLVQATDEA